MDDQKRARMAGRLSQLTLVLAIEDLKNGLDLMSCVAAFNQAAATAFAAIMQHERAGQPLPEEEITRLGEIYGDMTRRTFEATARQPDALKNFPDIRAAVKVWSPSSVPRGGGGAEN